jgi:hypothetical protein
MAFDKPAAVRTLQLFNQKASKLENLEFVRTVRSQKFGYTVSSGADGSFTVERHGPSDEAVDAFVLTYRFFVQDNEPTSFRRMAALYGEMPVDSPWKDGAQSTRQQLNSFLDGPTHIVVANHRITRRELHDTFLWGDLAHANKAKEDQLTEWAKRDGLIPVLQAEFIWVLADVFGAIAWFRSANMEVLKLLGSSG